MEYSFNENSKTLVCSFKGDITSVNCKDVMKHLEEELVRIFGESASAKLPREAKVVFDLKQVNYVSSVFLRVVIITAKKLSAGHFSVTNVNPFVQELFRSTGLDMLVRAPDQKIESTLHETRVFEPPGSFTREANLSSLDEYEQQYARSLASPKEFWAEEARRLLVWDQPFDQTFTWDCPRSSWFAGGKLNASVNCLDRHLGTPVADQAALIWEGEPGEERILTYAQLYREVCRFANVLCRNGIGRGDRVIIYLPMVPEAVIAMLACARLGVIHSVVFGGFSPSAIAERIQDCGACSVITADGGYRKGVVVPLKNNVDEALSMKNEQGQPAGVSVRNVIVLRRTGQEVSFQTGRDVWWHQELDQVDADCQAVSMDSEDLLFILYTSGSTGKPKGIMHTTAGYLLNCKLTFQAVFDIKPTDVYWCTADVGWITGHSYIVYGPLASGATVFLYEGAPNYPSPGRLWSLIEKHRITIFYTAPTAIRSFMQWGDHWPAQHDLSSLRLLGTVGEPINPQAWMWYYETIGHGRCPIVDTWWQTETGSIMISTIPGVMPAKPGSAGRPLFGIEPQVLDGQGARANSNSGGKLIISRPWPSMLRGVWGDPERFLWTYWKEFPGLYFTGDGAHCDDQGYFWIMGRIDDVINISGHRIGTAEVESALVSYPCVAEAAVVGRPDDLKGAGLVAFVILKQEGIPSDELRETLRQHVTREMGPIARPDEIRFTEALPKTRSGKIMRRVLKQVAAGTEITGDLTTLEDFGVLERLSEGG